MNERPVQLLTTSRLRAFRACARLHHLRYERRLAPVREADTTRFGTIAHVGLEAWWSTRAAVGAGVLSPGLELPAAISAMRERSGPDGEPWELVRAEVLLAGYHARWSSARLRPLAVEVEFTHALRNPETGRSSQLYQLGGKIDAIVEDESDGRRYLLEHKTTGLDISEGSTYWQRLRMDAQISHYYDGAAALGHEVSGCIYDVLARPAQRPLEATPLDKRRVTKAGVLDARQRDQAETLDEYRARLTAAITEAPHRYFARGMVVRLDSEMDGHRADAWDLAQLLRQTERTGRRPRNPDACERYGRMCEFFDACTGAASLDDPTRYRVLDTQHPELEVAHAAGH